MSAKSKSGLSETPSKASPATPRVAKLSSRGIAKSEPNSPSPLQNHRLSLDRSPKPVTSTNKPAVNRQSPKVTTPPEKPRTGVLKSSDLQAQLTAVKDDLKKAKEQIALIEKEKAQAIDELKQAQRVAEEANGRLGEAVVAKKRAEEDSEIKKFQTGELEQAGIEAAQKKEEECQREIEAVRNQHALDVAALLSTTQELQRAKQDLSMISDAKDQALSHANDATKIAEIHAEKVEILSAELTQLKAVLDSKHQTESNEYSETVSNLKLEIDTLKQELESAKAFEEKFVERESSIEQLNVELEAARMAESYARRLVDEWQSKVEELEKQTAEANNLKKSASESLESVMKQLEGNNDRLRNAESDIDALKEKLGLSEMTISTQKGDLEESDRNLNSAKEESYEMEKTVQSLKAELETVKEEKTQALNNEKLAASNVQNLLEEKNKLVNALDISREEEEKSKKAMESLASALHEVSSEAREANEKLLLFQTEHESYENQIIDLKMVLKAKNEKYENTLDDSKHEINTLMESLKQCEIELMNTKTVWEQKELHLVNCEKETEEKNNVLRIEVDRNVNLLKQAEDKARVGKEEEAQLKESLKEVEAEVIYLQETLGEAKAESMKLKESLLDKETELKNIFQENEELRAKEAAALQKVEEFSKLLEEATAKKQSEGNGELTDSEKKYDLLPKGVEFSEENGHAREEKPEELPAEKSAELKIDNSKEEINNVVSNDKAIHVVSTKTEALNGNSKPKDDVSKDDSVEVEYKMWESVKIEMKEFSPARETEHESLEDETESKVDPGENLEQVNGLASTENTDHSGNSPMKQPEPQPKKKKPLLKKFGSLLKPKKSSSNNQK